MGRPVRVEKGRAAPPPRSAARPLAAELRRVAESAHGPARRWLLAMAEQSDRRRGPAGGSP